MGPQTPEQRPNLEIDVVSAQTRRIGLDGPGHWKDMDTAQPRPTGSCASIAESNVGVGDPPRRHHAAPASRRAGITPRRHHAAPASRRAGITPRRHHAAPTSRRANHGERHGLRRAHANRDGRGVADATAGPGIPDRTRSRATGRTASTALTHRQVLCGRHRVEHHRTCAAISNPKGIRFGRRGRRRALPRTRPQPDPGLRFTARAQPRSRMTRHHRRGSNDASTTTRPAVRRVRCHHTWAMSSVQNRTRLPVPTRMSYLILELDS